MGEVFGPDRGHRMAHRAGHFMPTTLLPSQLSTLEPLEPDEDGVTITSRPTPEETLAAILEAVGLEPSRS